VTRRFFFEEGIYIVRRPGKHGRLRTERVPSQEQPEEQREPAHDQQARGATSKNELE
jgi:hypothetical protein